MNHTFLGFGAFELRDLVRGEEFFTSDGTPGRVSIEQRLLPEHIEVVLHPETPNAQRVVRHPTMRVFGTSIEQARRILRRLAARRRRKKEKGEQP